MGREAGSDAFPPLSGHESLERLDPDGELAEIYRAIARKVAVRIADRASDMSLKFPSIVVQNT